MIKLGNRKKQNSITMMSLNCAFCIIIITLQWSGTDAHYLDSKTLSPGIHPRGIRALTTIIASTQALSLTTFGFRGAIHLRLRTHERDSRRRSHLVVAKQTAGDLHPSAADIGIRRHFPLLFGMMSRIRRVSRTTEILRGHLFCLLKWGAVLTKPEIIARGTNRYFIWKGSKILTLEALYIVARICTFDS